MSIETLTQTIGLFIHLAGFIIGLGAVTVIDIHGFLGRKSTYWSEATIRTHKVTKPLIWLGMLLALIGGSLFYKDLGFEGSYILQPVIAGLLILNGLFLTFVVSPHLLKKEAEGKSLELLTQAWQKKIAVSFVVSFTGWWAELGFLVIRIIEQ